MSMSIGIDPARSAFRWVYSDDENSQCSHGEIYRPLGCPKKTDSVRSGYQSHETWGKPFGFRRHVFGILTETDTFERTSDLITPEKNNEWIRSVCTNKNPKLRPPIDSSATVTIAVPDHASLREQDAYLNSLPLQYHDSYLLWRPIAMVLAWMEQRKNKSLRDIGEEDTVITIDFDGGCPELSVIIFRHHEKTNEIVPVHNRPLRNTIAKDDEFEYVARKTVLGHVPEYEQILSGQFAGKIQATIESGAKETDVWVRSDGAWKQKHIELPTDLDITIWSDYIHDLLKAVRTNLKSSTVILNGWSARRFEKQLIEKFVCYCKECIVLSAESIAEGCEIFSRRRSQGLPTYYEFVPRYELWDGKKFEWQSLFVHEKEYIEPGEVLTWNSPSPMNIARNSDNVSVYIRSYVEKQTDDELIDEYSSDNSFARRLKVYFTHYLSNKVELNVTARVVIAKGSAIFRFAMVNQNEVPLFIRNNIAVSDVEFRYTEESDTNKMSEITEEPKHKGYLEPQPVLGRIYDYGDEEFSFLKMLKAYNENCRGDEFVKLFTKFQAKFGKWDAKKLTSRVGYNVQPEREPTRGMFGTKVILDRETENKEMQKYVANLWDRATAGQMFERQADSRFYKELNYCHSAAPKEYKNQIRQVLREGTKVDDFNFCYSPGYVLGDDGEDVRTLMNYIIKRYSQVSITPILWWSLSRMLCWHPESKLELNDLELVERCLKKMIREDANCCRVVDEKGRRTNERKFAALGVLYVLRIRESGADISDNVRDGLVKLFEDGKLKDVPFPKTMINNLGNNGIANVSGDNLSKFIVRFIKKEETLKDRELGASLSSE